MKYEELAKVSARYTAAHREMIGIINEMVELAELDKVSKNNEDAQEIMMAYSQTRTRLIDCMFWQRYLNQILVTRTDEARQAAKDYQEKLIEAEKKAKEAEKNGEVPPAPEAAPAEPAQEEGKPCLKLL